MKADNVTRYHPLLATLHWLLAFFIVAALILGFALLAETPNADPRKIDILRAHMTGGVVIFVLMLIRFVVRMRRRGRPRRRPAVACSTAWRRSRITASMSWCC